MKLNLKNIVVGGICMYVSMFAVSMIWGPLIHEGILEPLYRANEEFWHPALNEVPPDMAAVMPRWITVGLVMSLLFAGIYDNLRSAFNGSGLVKGLKFGIVLALLNAAFLAAYSGIFRLPDEIWFWWGFEGIFNYAVGGLVMGWVIGKWGTD